MIIAIIIGAIIDIIVLYACCVAGSRADNLIEKAWNNSEAEELESFLGKD